MKRAALLSLLALSCASHANSPAALEEYSQRLTAYHAAQARELSHTPILDRVQKIRSIAGRVNPYPVDLAKGREVYRTRCAPCHGSHGEGAVAVQRVYGCVATGPPLDRPDIRNEISVGTLAYVAGDTFGNMVQLGPMTEEDRWQVAAFVKDGW